MKKKILRIFFFMLCFCVIGFPVEPDAFEGKIPYEQPSLLERCNAWKVGDEIPDYLLMDANYFNHSHPFSPYDYIKEIKNKNLLFYLMVHPDCPQLNSATAFNQFLSFLKLDECKSYLNGKKEGLRKNEKFSELQSIFSDYCFQVYLFSINTNDLSQEEAVAVLSGMKSEIDAGENLKDIYRKYADKYLYQEDPEKNPDFYVTKICNNGDFYFSKATMAIFAHDRFSSWELSQKNLSKILEMKKGESIIVEEALDDNAIKNKRIYLAVILDALDGYAK